MKILSLFFRIDVSSDYEKDLSVRHTQKTGLFHENYQEGNKNDIALKELEHFTGINLATYLTES